MGCVAAWLRAARLVRGASARVLVEFADEASQHRADQRERAQQPETIEKTQNRGLALHLGVELRGGVRDGIRVRKTVLRQIGLRVAAALLRKAF